MASPASEARPAHPRALTHAHAHRHQVCERSERRASDGATTPMSAATPCAHLCVAERGSVHLARRELMVLNAFVGGLRQAARSARSNREEIQQRRQTVCAADAGHPHGTLRGYGASKLVPRSSMIPVITPAHLERVRSRQFEALPCGRSTPRDPAGQRLHRLTVVERLVGDHRRGVIGWKLDPCGQGGRDAVPVRVACARMPYACIDRGFSD